MNTEIHIILSEKGFSYIIRNDGESIQSHTESLYFPNYKKAFNAAQNRINLIKKECLDILKLVTEVG